MNWYYSQSLDIFVSLEPLKINETALKILRDEGCTPDWDDFGHLINFDYDCGRKIAEAMGGFILTPSQYWQLYKEALLSGNSELMDSLSSNEFTEYLDRVFISDDSYIDNPEIVGKYVYKGKIINNAPVVGRPGWITFEDINLETGLPTQVHNKEQNSGHIKYWSPDVSVTGLNACCAIRGYVTSVAGMSLDCGIPVDSRQPKLMLRLAMKNKPEDYLSNAADEEKLYEAGLEIIKTGKYMENKLRYEHLKSYLSALKSSVETSLEQYKMVYFVCGHKNPDTDTVISSLFEAFRLSLTNKDSNKVYIPLVQAETIPLEVRTLIGKEFSDLIPTLRDIDMEKMLSTGLVRFVFTDQNYQEELQKYVVSITDHHTLSSRLDMKNMTIPCHIEIMGSSTAMVYEKFVAQGYSFHCEIAQFLYGAMLMDTENRLPAKMTETDRIIMNHLKVLTDVFDDSEFYGDLMDSLLKEQDSSILYHRDYKVFKGFAFATLKVTNFFEDTFTSNSKVDEIIRLAEEDNKNNHYAFTLVKFVEYTNHGNTVVEERLYPVFNDDTPREFQNRVRELLKTIASHYLPDAIVEYYHIYLRISGIGEQLSRKKLAPPLEALTSCYDRFVYSESIGKYVATDFLKKNDKTLEADDGLQYTNDGYVCNITYYDAVKLAKTMDFELLSLSEYWKVYREMKEKGNISIIRSMTDSKFIEFLDTVADHGKIYDHPIISEENISGNLVSDDYLKAAPALINPDEIDEITGLPERIYPPSDYLNKELWRYWSAPKDDVYCFSRSYIFLLGQCSLDAKMKPCESFVNLGIRPVRTTPLIPEIKIEASDKLIIRCRTEYDNESKIIFEA